MGELEKLANTPKSFTRGDQIYKVRQLSLHDLGNIREDISDKKKQEYKKDIAEMDSLLPEKERSKVILDTIRNFKVTDEDIQNELVSRFGVIETLSIALKLAKDKIIELLGNEDVQDTLWDIFTHAMGIKDKEEDKVDKVEVKAE